MKLKGSLVSIIMPVYNAGKFLPECLEALSKQSYSNLEIIAVNDNSKDNSLKILKDFQKKLRYTRPERKMQILQNKKHYGPAICLNRALKLANGQFLALMNPNDTISFQKIKKQVKYLSLNNKVVAVGSQFATINENNKLLAESNLPQEHDAIYQTLLPSLSIKPESVMINRMLLPKDLLNFTSNKYPLIFTEVIIKLLQYGKIANLNETLYRHRIGIRHYTRRSSKIKQTFSLIQLLLKSRASYDYRPSLRLSLPTLLSPFETR